MSTILRSLKRLEKEKESSTGSPALLSAFGKPPSRLKKFWLKKNLLLWVLPLCLLIAGAAGYSLFSRRAPQPVKAIAGAPPAAHPAVKKGVEPSGSPGSAEPGALPAQAGPAPGMLSQPQDVWAGAEHRPWPSTPAPPLAAADVPAESAPPVAQNLEPKGAMIPAVPAVEPSVAPGNHLPPAPAQAPFRSAPAGPNPAARRPVQAEERHPDAEPVTDGHIKVQAIVWCASRDGRMAVVNNQIVREGSAAKGISIVKIDKEAVFVEEGGKLLKVPFGRN